MNQEPRRDSRCGDKSRVASQKRRYRRPVLTDLGPVAQATLGGTVGTVESGNAAFPFFRVT